MFIHIPAIASGYRVDGPWNISHPLEKLRSKYLSSRGNFRTLDYDLYAAQRTNGSWENRIEGSDWYATLLMNSFIRNTEVDEAMQHVATVETHLASIPVGADLAVATLTATSTLTGSLASVLSATSRRGVNVAKVTKLLWMKRPRLIPMLDSRVCEALLARSNLRLGPAFGPAAVGVVQRFQAVMTWTGTVAGQPHDNLHVLNQLETALAQEIQATLAIRGWQGPFPQPTPVRILESLIWFDWGGWKWWPAKWRETATEIGPIP